MRVLVTGSNGQLGSAIREIAYKYDNKFIFTDVDALDITNQVMVDDYLSKTKPDIVINCAAYTNVDKAESEPDKAFLINSEAVKILAEATKKQATKIIHISTDFVFDGNKKIPYNETDNPHPLSVYARSKLSGELELTESAAQGLILRTSWLFSEFGHNFVKTIYNLAQNKTELRVVNDQYGSPTYAGDLAEVILKIIEQYNWKDEAAIYHYSNSWTASWFELAEEIVKISGFDCRVIPVSTEEYGAKVARPSYSVLDTSKIRSEFGIVARSWKSSLKECLSIIETRDSVLETRKN